MSDAVAAVSAAPAKVKKTKAKTTKPKTTAAHPPVMDMVKAAIKASKERKGTSLATIKKYIAANYKVDLVRLGPFIRKAVATGAEKGVFSRVGNKGKGASGSFKIGEKAKSAEKKPKVKKAKKPTTPKKKATKPKVKKPASAKKAKSPKKVKKPKSPKVKKSPAKKTKKVVKKPAAK